MNGFEIAIAALLAFVTVEQAVAVFIFLAYCRKSITPRADEDLPQTLVVLALRGCDESLPDCLRALFAQDYPKYTICIVVDSRVDPAWSLVQQTIRETAATHVRVLALENPSPHCTLKCSALYLATAELEPAVEVVAFLDADVIPHPTWLRELVNPLDKDSVGAAMGNRWYAPRVGQWGSLVRTMWNVGAVINMYFYGVPWGGTLAVRADILRNSELRSQWTKAGCDDVPLFNVLRKLRLKLVFVPDLLLVNREETSLANCFSFLWRQMLWVRLYHPVCWYTCTVFQYLIMLAQYALLVLIPWAVVTQRWFAAGTLAGFLLVNQVVTYGLAALAEGQARRALATRGGGNTVHWFRLLLAVQFAQPVAGLAFVYALFARVVEWRGIRYRIRGPWNIQMLEYHPITVTPAGNEPERDSAEMVETAETQPTKSKEE